MSSEEETKKLLETFSKLSSAGDDYYELVQKNIYQYNEWLLSGNKVAAAEERKAVILNKSTQAYESQLKALGLTKNALGEFERLTIQLTKEQKRHIAEEQAITERQNARDKVSATYHSMMADKMGTTIKGLNAFGAGLNKTLLDSTKGQAKYGSALSSAGDQVQQLGSLFGPLGKAVTYVLGAFMKLGGAALEQQEHLNTAYEKMAEFGAIDVTGVAGMFKNLQNAGFTVKELEKFGGILKTAGPNLAIMGTTAADGAKKFADTLAVVKNSGVEKELRMLGFTSETMAKTFADYQGLMARQGFLQGKSTAQIAQESAKYAKTLDELSKLTGETRDEMQKRMEADANDMKFRLKIEEMERAGDKAGADRLRKASVLIADFGEDTASGFREMIANNGDVVGDASAKLMLSTGNAARQITQDLNAGKISHLEAARLMAEAKANQIERFRTLGKLDTEIMKELGLSVKDMDAANKYRGKTQKDLEDIENKQKLQASGALDKQRAAEVARQMTERNLEQSKDRLINIVGTKMVGAFEKLMQMVNEVAKQLAHFLKWLGGPDFTDLFDTPKDIKANLDKTAKELDATNKRIKEINEAGERYQQKKTEVEKRDVEIRDLETKLRQETNVERKKELAEELRQARYKQSIAVAEMRQAGQDKTRGQGELSRLTGKKGELEKQKAEQERRLAEKGGVEEEDSPEVKKLKEESAKLAKERADLEELEADKSKLLYNQTLAKLGIGEKDLENKENAEKFEKAYADAKKKYVDRQTEIDKRLIKIGEENASIQQKAAEAKLASRGAGGASPAAPTASAGGGAATAGAGAPMAKSMPSSVAKKKGASAGGGEAPATPVDTDVSKLIRFQGDSLGTKTHYDKLDGDVKNNFEQMIAAFGKPVQINAAFRSEQEQKLLYDAWIRRGKSGNPVAPPGKSNHNHGRALDLNSAQVNELEKEGLLAEFGFARLQGDPPHIQMARHGGVFNGPESGYPVLLHGRERVEPVRNTKNLGSSASSVSKTELSQLDSKTVGGSSESTAITQFMTLQSDLMNMIATKLDSLDSRLAKSNDIQENILTYSAA